MSCTACQTVADRLNRALRIVLTWPRSDITDQLHFWHEEVGSLGPWLEIDDPLRCGERALEKKGSVVDGQVGRGLLCGELDEPEL